VSYAEYGKVMNQAYRDLVGGVTDPEERAEILRPIMEFAETLDNGDTAGERPHTLKSITATMQSARDQFAGLV
jgi:hypothetical protein